MRFRAAANRILIACAVLLFVLSPDLGAQNGADTAASSDDGDRPSSLTFMARRIAVPKPAVDGRLDDPAWALVHDSARFTQREPESGSPATQPTGIDVLYDESAIFVAMRMWDAAPDSVAAQLSRRDTRGDHSDWAHVYLDSYNDRRTAFRFSTNPRGVQIDAVMFGDTQEDTEWDAVWTVATRVDSLGWTAEFRIPLSQVRFASDDGDGMVWGVNFGREIARRGEVSFWAPILGEDAGFVSRFGRLEGLANLSAPRRLEIQPYTVSRLTRAPTVAGDPFHSANEFAPSVGLDLRYGITSDFTMNLAVNPDFGQVEADPSVVNLSAFETFFAEKRPFFIEGTDLFQLTYPQWPPLFYSRRIGRRPQGGVPGTATFADVPEATTILTAGKITGKTARGLSVGLIGALTDDESARYVAQDGDVGKQTVEPATMYTAARITQDFRGGRSAIGLLATATNRRLEAPSLASSLHSAGYVAGVDGRHRFGGGNYELAASFVGSHVRGTPDALARTQRAPGRYFQRPDATHLAFDSTRTSLSGTQAGMRIAKVGGGQWRWELNSTYVSPGFEVNDLGFLNGGDRISLFTRVGYDQFRGGGPFRRWDINALQASGWTTGGEYRYGWVELFGSAQFHNQWSFNLGFDRTFSSLSVTELRGGPALRTPGYWSGWFGLNTDPRRKLRFGGWSFWMVKDQGTGSRVNLNPHVTFRPSPNLEVRFQPGIGRYTNEFQYVSTDIDSTGTGYLFGRLRQTTVSFTTRFNYTFTPRLSLQLYAQPFLSAADYDRLSRVVDPRAARVEDRFTPAAGTASEPDFNFKQFRSTLVLRWEYRPGSTIFLVWSQDRTAFDPDGSFDLTRDFGRLFAADATDVFLVKVNYWFSR